MIKVGGEDHPWREGMTVAQLLKEMNDPYPYAVVRLNGKLVSLPDFDKTPIPDEAEIFFIPIIAGG